VRPGPGPGAQEEGEDFKFMENDNDNDTRPIEAVHALRARGVDQAEAMLAEASPDEILAACHRWDSRSHVGPGLLVRWIREHEYEDPPEATPPSKAQQLRDRFEDYARRFPTGTAAESHRDLIARRWPAELEYGLICEGDLIVIEATYPLLTMECDRCGFVAALPIRALHILGAPLRLAEPPAQPF
jgi:hypothetical protein